MVISLGKTISKIITRFQNYLYFSPPLSFSEKLRYIFPIDLFPSKLKQTVASTLMPLTTEFLVILMDNLGGRHIAEHSTTSSEHKIGDTTTR